MELDGLKSPEFLRLKFDVQRARQSRQTDFFKKVLVAVNWPSVGAPDGAKMWRKPGQDESEMA